MMHNFTLSLNAPRQKGNTFYDKMVERTHQQDGRPALAYYLPDCNVL